MFKTEFLRNNSYDFIDIVNIPFYMAEFKRLYQNLKETISNQLIDDDYINIKKQCSDLNSDVNTIKDILIAKKSKIVIEKSEEETSIDSTIDNYLIKLEQLENIIKQIETTIKQTENKIEQIEKNHYDNYIIV